MAVFIKTTCLAIAGGYLFNLINMPVPWMLGALSAVLLFNQGFRQSTFWPFSLREAAQIILGYVMGSSFTPDAGVNIIKSLPSMLIANILIIAFTILVGYHISRIIRISYPSCILGCIPGGMAQMILLCDDIQDSDVTVVTFMQSVRLITVVFIVPFLVLHSASPEVISNGTRQDLVNVIETISYGRLAYYISLAWVGGLAAKKLKIPTPYMLGPILIVAAHSLAGLKIPAMPSLMVIAAQVSFGAYLGNNIKIKNLGDWKRMLALTIVSSLAVIALAFLMGYVLTILHSLELLTAFLALAPGGMSEMAVTAITVNAELSTVTSYQLFRVLFIILVTPPFLKWILVNRNKSLERS